MSQIGIFINGKVCNVIPTKTGKYILKILCLDQVLAVLSANEAPMDSLYSASVNPPTDLTKGLMFFEQTRLNPTTDKK